MIIRQDQRPNKMIWVTFRKEGIHTATQQLPQTLI